MLKNILFSLSLLTATSGVVYGQSSEYWEGCGISPEKAKSALAQNIMVKVESSFTLKEKSSFFKGFESTSSESKSSDKQTSTMFLNDVESYKNANNEFCAKVNKKKLHTFAKNKHRNLNTDYKISSLNIDDVRLKAKTIDSWLISLSFLKGLTEVFSDLKVEKINDRVKDLQNIRKKLYLQSVTINKTGAMKGHFTLKVDNKERNFSKKIYLEADKEHTYSVDGHNICKFTDTFTLAKDEDSELSVDVDDQSYPTFTISANKPKDIKFFFNGEEAKLGSAIEVPKCSGTLSYSLTYEQGLPKSNGDEVALEAGLEYDRSYSFQSFKEIERLSGLAKNLNDGKRLEIGYGYRSIRQDSFEDSYTNYAESLETVKISYMQYKNWLRHGANIAYSTTEGKYISPRTYGFDVTYLAAFQLTTFGVEDSSLTLFNTFALVPYFGFEVGLGTLKMYNESTKESYYEFEEGDDFSAFVNNYVVAKGVVGMDVVFSEQIAFGLRYSKEMTLLDSQNFAIYVSLSL